MLGLLAAALLAGCASRSNEVMARPVDPSAYAGWTCERLFDETDQVQLRAADVAYAVDARAGNNMIALGLGVTVFWPAMLAMRPDGPEAVELAELKGRFEALRQATEAQACGPAPRLMAVRRAATLPVAVGDRLVYEQRASVDATPQRLGMKVTQLRRGQIAFEVDLDGQAMAEPWLQDLHGNPVLDGRPPLIGWQRLLRGTLDLGQLVSGDLAAAGETLPRGRVRGQVVAVGPQQLAGRQFDVAVIELFGDAPQPATSVGEHAASTRLDGVMAVDRRSGVLLRLELRCANPAYAVRRRLVRVEAANS